jgi:hypothetical protein
MTYAVYIGLILLLAYQEYRHREERREVTQERATWADERKSLLDRIQAPHAAQVAATEALTGASGEPLTDAERIRRRAEDMGLSVDELRLPPGWGAL